VRRLSFQVEEGQIVTLLGANGAGKTSVIRAVCGLVPVPGDPLTYSGRPLNHLRPEMRVALGIATVPEGRELFRSLTVDENLRLGAFRRRDRAAVARDLAWVYDLFPVLAARRKQFAGTLSGGQGQMLAIGRALMAAPRLLLLDEPSHGLAPLIVDEIFALIPRLRAERALSILLVEQNANKALTVASYGYVLEAGSLALEGPTKQLLRDPRVRALYLGG
jgi:branched-chain amino acid transport system ATP-binding protein